MMGAAERHGIFVAHLTAERPLLSKAQVVRVAGLAAAHEAGLAGHKLEVRLVAAPARLTYGERALVDAGGLHGRFGGHDVGTAGGKGEGLHRPVLGADQRGYWLARGGIAYG